MHFLYAYDRAPDDFLVQALRELSHAVDLVSRDDAVTQAAQGDYDMIFADLLDGAQEVARNFVQASQRAGGGALIVLLLPQGTQSSVRAAALRAGADACFEHPLHIGEIIARLRALNVVAERARKKQAGPPQLSLLASQRTVRLGGVHLILSPINFQLLSYLARRPGHVIALEALGRNVWGEDAEPDPVRVRHSLSRLRRKLQDAFGVPLIHNVRGQGYVYRPSDAPKR